MKKKATIEREIGRLRKFILKNSNTDAADRAVDYLDALLWVVNKARSPFFDVKELSN